MYTKPKYNIGDEVKFSPIDNGWKNVSWGKKYIDSCLVVMEIYYVEPVSYMYTGIDGKIKSYSEQTSYKVGIKSTNLYQVFLESELV